MNETPGNPNPRPRGLAFYCGYGATCALAYFTLFLSGLIAP